MKCRGRSCIASHRIILLNTKTLRNDSHLESGTDENGEEKGKGEEGGKGKGEGREGEEGCCTS